MRKKLVYGSALFIIMILFFIVYYSKTSLSTLRVTNILPISVITLFQSPATTTETTIPTAQGEKTPVAELSNYIEVMDSCSPYYVGECVNVRSGPGTSYPVVMKLRTGVVLKVGETVTENGEAWYKIIFTRDLLYPERVKGSWYVSAKFVRYFSNDGDFNIKKGIVSSSTKHILVDVSEEMLYAYDGDTLFMKEPISTGLEFTPTPRGTFTVFTMTPSRFMQGPIKGVSDQVYDLPGVPWNLYFTQDGAVIHGAYWHDKFGQSWSHGCVNLSPENAKKLYYWAELGMKVTVQN